MLVCCQGRSDDSRSEGSHLHTMCTYTRVAYCSSEQDPAVPGLAREAWKAFKKKFISYLGQEATRSPQGNPSSGTLATIDKSHILSPPLRREDRRHDLPGTIRDGDEDGAAWESDEDATKFAARSTESRTRRSGGGRLDVTKYQPLLLHEYAPYLHRRFNSAGEGADDAYDKNTEKREPPTTATTPAAARRATAAPFTTTPITSRSSRTKSFTFLQQREREAHNTDHDYPYDDLCGVIGDDYDALLSTMISSRATGLTAQQRGDSVNYYDDVEDDIGTYGAGRPTSSGDGPGVMERWDKEGTIGKGEEKKNTPGDYGEGENTIFLGENDRDGVGGVYKTTHSRRKLIRNRRLRR